MNESNANALDEQIAQSMEIDVARLELLPHLLAGLDDFGSDPARLIALLEQIDFLFRGAALDLGCGKGAFAIALARRGMDVMAIDGFPAFIDVAADRARREGVADHCTFHTGDLRQAVKLSRTFDLISLISVGPVWSGVARTIRAMRGLTRPGGIIIYEDGWLPDRQDRRHDGESILTFYEISAALQSAGDRLIRIDTPTIEETETINSHNMNAIRDAALQLQSERPEYAGALDEYLAEQERQCALMNSGQVRASTFLLQRSAQ